MSTVVFFHAHPDDEASLTAGTMARLARDHRVVLVIATRGEQGECPEGLLAPGQTLRDRRTAEALWSAELLGVARVAFLDYLDSGMAGTAMNEADGAFCRADLDEAAHRLRAILDEEQADLLTVYDDHGGYGHPDHVMVHRVGTRAAALAGGVALYEATINRDHLRRGVEALAARDAGSAALVPDFGDNFGEPEASITHVVDVTDLCAVKRRALSAHSSQIAETSFFLALPDQAFRAGFGYEWFIKRCGARDGRPTCLDLISGSPASLVR
jgi:LmbE family N-acetylglucosaminyl deacetylase